MSATKFAVRDANNRTYFRVGAHEAFLLGRLKEPTSLRHLAEAYAERFQEPLNATDLDEFLQKLAQKGFLEFRQGDSTDRLAQGQVDDSDVDDDIAAPCGSLLFYRVPLANPDRFLDQFVRLFPFFWTRGFLLASSGMMFLALIVLVTNHRETLASIQHAAKWETLAVAAVAIFLSTVVHEIGHGATCKRFGGDVHESGFLFMLFMPCLYVNVSDAWLIQEKWKRLAITLAGSYCDLCIWAASVFVWRITLVGSLPNYVAFVLLSTCGARCLMNFNPFLRMDGYYLLSDWLEYPNLYSRARNYWFGLIRSFLWGAPWPKAPRRKWLTLFYGMTIWIFAILFLNIVGLQLMRIANSEFGLSGLVVAGAFFLYGLRRVFRGLFGDEFFTMLWSRWRKTIGWCTGVLAIVGGAYFVPLNHYAVGDFEVRPSQHVEIASPQHSFIAAVHVHDGQPITEAEILVEMHAPELATMIAAKEAEIAESNAKLSKLKTGPRAEEIQAHQERVVILTEFRDLGDRELESAKRALDFELKSLRERSRQVRLQIELAEEVLKKSQELYQKGAVPGAQLLKEKSQLSILRSQLAEQESEYESRSTEGTRLAQAELARRQQQLAEASSQLRLIQLGTRPEEIEAEEARARRLQEEHAFLLKQKEKLVVKATAEGIVSAPRFGERVGQFVPQGGLLCRIEDPGVPNIEIFVSEDDAATIFPGQRVELKARSIPFETFQGVVDRVAPDAAKPRDAVASQQSFVRQSVVVHCRIQEAEDKLKAGMTGTGRIYRDEKSVGAILASKIYKYVRTEFWW